MGFFEKIGRKVGRFTHEAKEAAADGTEYVCEDCGEEFYTDQETCPNCESDAVRERAPAGDETSPTEADETTDDESPPT